MVIGVGALLGAEILLAQRREYLPTEPALELGGWFGPPNGDPLTFVVLGDSTAAGVGAESASKAYPTLLARRLAHAGRRIRLVALGVSGARVRDVLVAQVPAAVRASPDLVLVAVGANDVTHLTGRPSVRRDTEEILRRLKSAGAAVVVSGVPDMRARAFLEPLRSISGWRGRRLSEEIRAAAQEESLPFVPLAERTGHLFEDDPQRYYSPDYFHPGPPGYAAWADAMYPELEAALGG